MTGGVGELRGLIEVATPLNMLMLALVLGAVPELLLRIGLMLYPRHHDRRRELIAEMAIVPTWKRPIWGAQLFMVGLFEGPAARRDARQERNAGNRDATVSSEDESDDTGIANGTGAAHEPTVRAVDGGSGRDQGTIVVEEHHTTAVLAGEGRLTAGLGGAVTVTATATASDAAPAEDRVGSAAVVIQPDPPWGFIQRRRTANLSALRSDARARRSPGSD